MQRNGSSWIGKPIDSSPLRQTSCVSPIGRRSQHIGKPSPKGKSCRSVQEFIRRLPGSFSFTAKTSSPPSGSDCALYRRTSLRQRSRNDGFLTGSLDCDGWEAVTLDHLSRSPRMNCSTQRYASSSVIWTGGCFEKYADAECNTPPIPRSSASLQQRIASIATPAEFGESSTESFTSISIGTSPNSRPSTRIKAILLSSCQGT